MKKNGMSSHQSPKMESDVWLTPPSIIKALGRFDLDPCSPENRPWDTAIEHYSHDGLALSWHGRVWCNPPYGKETGKWLSKLAKHGNGIALIFARTETRMFFDNVWEKADAVLFLKGRLHFCRIDGQMAKANAGAPSCLIAYGQDNVEALRGSEISGKLVRLR